MGNDSLISAWYMADIPKNRQNAYDLDAYGYAEVLITQSKLDEARRRAMDIPTRLFRTGDDRIALYRGVLIIVHQVGNSSNKPLDSYVEGGCGLELHAEERNSMAFTEVAKYLGELELPPA